LLEFALWPLWRILKGPLEGLLKDKFSLVGGQFKALLSSTVDDLVAALQEDFFATGTWKHLAAGKIQKKGSDRYAATLLSVGVFPPDAIEASTKIRASLVDRLSKNVRLDALRTDAGIADQDWKNILDVYAKDVVRHALPFALRRMIKHELPLYLSSYVIDLAQLEPIRIKGKAGHHKLVVLYEQSTLGGKPTVSKAMKIWKRRTSSSYDYSLGDYDGFIAL
jgi:hypothetical protein